MRRRFGYLFLFVLTFQFQPLSAEPQSRIQSLAEEPAQYFSDYYQLDFQLNRPELDAQYSKMAQRIEELNAEIMKRLSTGERSRELYVLMTTSLALMSALSEEAILIYVLGNGERAMKFLDRYYKWEKIRSEWPFQWELEQHENAELIFNLHFLSGFEGFLNHPFILQGFDIMPIEQIRLGLSNEVRKLETGLSCSGNYMLPPLEFIALEGFLSEKTWGELNPEEKEQLEYFHEQLYEFKRRGCSNWSFELLDYLVLEARGDPNKAFDPSDLYISRAVLSKFSLSGGGFKHMAIQKKICEATANSADIGLNTLCTNLAKAHAAILGD